MYLVNLILQIYYYFIIKFPFNLSVFMFTSGYSEILREGLIIWR